MRLTAVGPEFQISGGTKSANRSYRRSRNATLPDGAFGINAGLPLPIGGGCVSTKPGSQFRDQGLQAQGLNDRDTGGMSKHQFCGRCPAAEHFQGLRLATFGRCGDEDRICAVEGRKRECIRRFYRYDPASGGERAGCREPSATDGYGHLLHQCARPARQRNDKRTAGQQYLSVILRHERLGHRH